MRITNHQRQEVRKALTKPGLALKQFILAESDDKLSYQFRLFDFHFTISKVADDIYEVTYNTVDHLSNYADRKRWSGVVELLESWAAKIALDQSAAPKDEVEPENLLAFQDTRHVSRRFKRIFHQAERAEKMGLDEICGMGYRKAVEVLIKDYLIKKRASERDRILEMKLGQCIEQYVTSDELKLLATRSAWLGNNFSHYLRIWKERSISDLKYFIHVTVRWIGFHEDLNKVQRLMPIGRRIITPKKPQLPSMVSSQPSPN